METIIIIIIVAVILGAFLGGKGFGDTVRKGCGFMVLIILVLFAAFMIISRLPSENNSIHQNAIPEDSAKTLFQVNRNCYAYTKPDINSSIFIEIKRGEEFYVESVSKFNYFYEVYDNTGVKCYILKENLSKK